MKLPNHRALALLGLLTLAGLLIPREGAATRFLGRQWVNPPGTIAGDPDTGGWNKRSPSHYVFGAASIEGRTRLIIRATTSASTLLREPSPIGLAGKEGRRATR